jgi:hypothetical protein
MDVRPIASHKRDGILFLPSIKFKGGGAAVENFPAEGQTHERINEQASRHISSRQRY